MKLTFNGAAHEVTGSCHCLEACNKKIIVDCGMEQDRVLDGKAVVAVYNNGDSPVSMEFQLPVEASGVEDLLADCVGSQPILTQVEWGKLKVQLPSNYATLLQLV